VQAIVFRAGRIIASFDGGSPSLPRLCGAVTA
jgi:hypothetical protein